MEEKSQERKQSENNRSGLLEERRKLEKYKKSLEKIKLKQKEVDLDI